MNITIIAVGKIKEKYYSDAVSEYLKRLSRFGKTEIIEIPDEKIPCNVSPKQAEQIKSKEGEKILRRIKENTFFISLCVEGKEFSSEEIASEMAEISVKSGHITFVIGGSLGLSDEVKKASDLRLSVGRITLPHQLMRVVLLEQIYRAFKINANETYHK